MRTSHCHHEFGGSDFFYALAPSFGLTQGFAALSEWILIRPVLLWGSLCFPDNSLSAENSLDLIAGHSHHSGWRLIWTDAVLSGCLIARRVALL